MNRTDRGFYVKGRAVMQSGLVPNDGTVIAVFSGLAIEGHPTIPHELANILNRKAGLDEIALPKPKKRRAA